ncbi:MAG: two-component system response regulator [Chloroflexota bacterium]
MNSTSKIVVIDDTSEILELIEVVLEDEGYEVIRCQDQTQALGIVIAEQPSLVIIDLRMAGVSQWELVDTIFTHQQTARVPVIVCSGAVAELHQAEARLKSLGGDILVKPFDIQALLSKVKRLLPAS